MSEPQADPGSTRAVRRAGVRHARRRRRLWSVVGVVGELLITAGVIIGLFLVWMFGFVAVVEGREQADEVARLEQQFAGPDNPVVSPAPTPSGAATAPPSPADPGPSNSATTASSPDAVAILRIPRLGNGWAKPVFEGVTPGVLARGLGHYPGTGTGGPTAPGNLAIAGHRSGHGNPLIDIDQIRSGDALVVENAQGWQVYRVSGHEIVTPDRSDVVAPVPGKPGATPTERWLTITTCNPRFGNSHRYIVHARLERAVPRAEGAPTDVLGAGQGG